MVLRQELDRVVTVTGQNSFKKKKGSCSQSILKKQNDLYRWLKSLQLPAWPPRGHYILSRPLFFLFFLTFWGIYTLLSCLMASCGAKQVQINLPFLWIFRYSCLWHADSSWCSWAPQISPRHAWTEASASGPTWAQPALTRPRITSHQWVHQHMVTLNISVDTFRWSRCIWWACR